MKTLSLLVKAPIKYLTFFSLILLLLTSCKNAGTPQITVDKNNYPVISIKNPFGKNIVISSPSAEIGSIGVETGNTVYWMKGKPILILSDKKAIVYSWLIKTGDTLSLSISEGEKEYNIQILSKNVKATRYFANFLSTETAYFTGIFERVIDGPQTDSWKKSVTTALNLRGEKANMKLYATTSAYAPFYISSENYSMFVHGTWEGVFDFCKQFPADVLVSFEGPSFDFTLSVADTPKELVQKHALETGPSIIPPDWALGPWRWRDEHFNRTTYYDGTPVKAPFNSSLVEDVLLMKYFDIPTTAIWIDRPWAKGFQGYEDFEFDTIKFPKPEKMIKWVNANNKELMLWIAPFVCGDQADYALKKGYDLIGRTPGRGIQRQGMPGVGSGLAGQGMQSGRLQLIDFTNPEAAKWWGENGPAKMAKMGIKGFKLDRADGEMEVDSLHLITDAGTSYRENYNDYPRQFTKTTYDALKPVLGDNFILFPRALYTGSAKYGAMWAGDIRGEAEAFRAAIIAVQRCAVMGYPLWGADIGGYHGFYRAIVMRWLGFGCFSPIMEVGPTENRGFWDNTNAPTYDTALIATWRLYAKTRMKLVPYIKQLAEEAHKSGTPIARPLFLEYPSQPEAWKDWQTYLLGTDILVSVIWEEGKNEQNIYLPGGETWIDAWDTGKEYKGGQYLKVTSKPYQIPLFIRKGSTLNLGDLNALYEESFLRASKKGTLADLEAAEGWK